MHTVMFSTPPQVANFISMCTKCPKLGRDQIQTLGLSLACAAIVALRTSLCTATPTTSRHWLGTPRREHLQSSNWGSPGNSTLLFVTHSFPISMHFNNK
jgi:hypothetical protein